MADIQYSEPVGDSWKYNPEYNQVADFLGIDKFDREDLGVANKISVIREWAGLSSKDNSLEGALTSLKEYKSNLGIPYLGKQLVDELYTNIRLEASRTPPKEVKKIETKKEVKPKEEQTLEGAITQAVQGSIANVVKKALSDKEFMSKTINTTVQEAVK